MKQTHINCPNQSCKICIYDHSVLFLELESRLGMRGIQFDHLFKLYTWLTEHGINPLTKHGWGTLAMFDDNNIDAYIADYKGEIHD